MVVEDVTDRARQELEQHFERERLAVIFENLGLDEAFKFRKTSKHEVSGGQGTWHPSPEVDGQTSRLPQKLLRESTECPHCGKWFRRPFSNFHLHTKLHYLSKASNDSPRIILRPNTF